MAQKNNSPVVDPEYVQSSNKMWHNFTKGALYATVVTVVILALMGLTLL